MTSGGRCLIAGGGPVRIIGLGVRPEHIRSPARPPVGPT